LQLYNRYSMNLSPAPKLQFFTEGGIPLVGGKLYSYAAGTTTPLPTYTTESGAQNNTNPIILDSRGEASVWLGAASYKLKLTDSSDVEIWTVDNITTQEAMNALTAFEASLASTQGSSLVGYLPANGPPGRTVQAKLRDVVSVKDFGAVGDGTADDTTALQAAIAYCENATQYGGRALYLPGGRYKISASLTISKEFITIYGDGPWESQIYAVGLSTPVIKTAAMQYLRPFLHDFGVVNTGTGKGIDFSNITGQVYLGELKNLYLESGDDGFYAPRFFSMMMMNVSSFSRTGHSFRVNCGPGVTWISCYALTCGLGKAGYRLTGSILMNACNGLNDGDYWGVFGSDPTNLDGFQSDFVGADYPDITLLNCNIEHFGSLSTAGEGIRVENAYRSFTMIGGKFDRSDLTTAYQAIVHCLAGSNGGTEPVRLGVGYVFPGTGVPSLAYLYSNGQATFFDTNDQFYGGGITSFKQSATVYPILRQWVAGDIYGNNAHYFSAISPRRTSLQMVRYAEPAALTPSGVGTTIVVTGYTKVVVAAAPGTTLTTATFDNTPNTVSDYGRNGDLLIEAGNANLTINHSASGANTFKLTGGAPLALAAGQVVRFCLSDTGGNWWQV
jgi:hypothetical protein